MKFYTKQHQHYCGIDLHTKSMYLCIINSNVEKVLHKNLKTDPRSLYNSISPFLPDIAIAAECIFTWYRLPDFKKNITFKANRTDIVELFPDPSVQKSIQCDLDLLISYHKNYPGYGALDHTASQRTQFQRSALAADDSRGWEDTGTGAALRNPRYHTVSNSTDLCFLCPADQTETGICR